jgi:Bacterial SH3 domain
MNTLSHIQARDLLLDRNNLRPEETAALEAHLARCAECRAYAVQAEGVRVAATQVMHKRWDKRQPPRDFEDNLRDRLRNETMQKNTFSLRAWASAGLAVVVVGAFIWVAQSVSKGGPGAVSTATSVPVPTATDIVVTPTAVPATATPEPAATATEWPMGSAPTSVSAPTDSAPALSVPEVTPWMEASDGQPYLTASRAEPVYIRSGPDLAFAEWATLAKGRKFSVIGQVTSWWQIDTGMGSEAWVKQSEVDFSGDWNKVPYKVMPTLPPPPGATATP